MPKIGVIGEEFYVIGKPEICGWADNVIVCKGKDQRGDHRTDSE
jgi:hypothetical protein